MLLTLGDTSSNCCGLDMKYECGRRDRQWGNVKERDGVFNLGVDWRILLKLIIKK